MNKKRLFAALAITLILVLFVFWQTGKKQTPGPADQTPPTQNNSSENEKPKIVSTNPDPLENAIIPSDQQIEIVFNRGLENEGELKLRFDPKVEYKITLSQDRKTAKIIPQTPFELGVTYTLFILPDSKFQGVGEWGEDKIFHFQTIKYRGV